MSTPEEQVDVPETAAAPVAAADSKDDREHVNLVFIGHVDAGKSTLSGQILVTTGQVDKRTMERYEKEAKEKNRESWYLAYVMDTSEEERERGKTVECGKASFSTEKKRYTLLDAPGHNAYVPSMIAGASQADIGCLVISARKGEFEAGFDKGGQTLVHMLLARTLGVQRLFILINKMDDPTVKWDKARYDDIVHKLSKALKGYGFSSSEYQFIPCSALTAANIKDRTTKEVVSWYDGPSFFEALDAMAPLTRYSDRPLRVPISARYKDMGVLALIGKVESGTLKKGDSLMVVPSNKKLTVASITSDDVELSVAPAGSNVIIAVKGIEEEDISQGHVLCPANAPGYRSNMIEAQIMITDLNDEIPLMSAGYTCVLHVHSATVECKVKALVQEFDKKGNVLKEHPDFFRVGSIGIVRLELDESVAIEKAVDFPQLGRFALRDKTKTIAIGKVLRLKPT